jgi:ECF sigma factor
MAEDSIAPGELTELLQTWRGGDRAALDRVMPVIYDELRSLAARYLSSERSPHTLQTTALVHEAYLRLAGQHHADWKNRALLRCRGNDHAPHPGRPRATPRA